MDHSLDKEQRKGRVLIVEGESETLQSLIPALQAAYQIERFQKIPDALRYLEEQEVDIIFADLVMKSCTGIDFLRRCAEKNTTAIRVLITPSAEMPKAVNALVEGQAQRYIVKPWLTDQLRFFMADIMEIQHLRRANKALTEGVLLQKEEFEELNNILLEQVTEIALRLSIQKAQNDSSYKHELDGIVLLLLRMIEIHNGDTIGANQTCAQLAMNFARFLKLSPERINAIYYAGLLRNIGKSFLPDNIVRNPIRELSEYEKEQYARFPVLGQIALMMLEPFSESAIIVRNHMELFNGKGYPDRLSGQAISLECRILRLVCDYMDLQKPNNILGVVLEELQARKYIQQMAEVRYDARLVQAFMTFLYDHFEYNAAESIEITLDSAQPGMRLMADALSSSGVVVLSKGVVLTSHHLQKLAALQRPNKPINLLVQRELPPDQASSS